MMNPKQRLLTLISFTIGCGLSVCHAGIINHSESFSTDNLSVQETVINGETYSIVNLPETENRYFSEGISLPYKTIQFSVPFNSDDFSLSVTSSNSSDLHIEYPIITFYAENKGCIENEMAIDHMALFNDADKQGVIAEIVNESFVGAFNRTIAVAIYPCRYNAESSDLTLISDFTIKLEWNDKPSEKQMKAVIPNSSKTFEKCMLTAKNSVVNPQDVENNLPPTAQTMCVTNDSNENEEEYEYIIVTSKDYAEAFERLAAIRRLKGYSSKIFQIEDILSDERFANGDEISGFVNEAGKLRAFLTYAWANYGTRYVLLAGKDAIPVITRKDIYEGSRSEYYDTDLYFSDLNNSWSNFLVAQSLSESLKEIRDLDS